MRCGWKFFILPRLLHIHIPSIPPLPCQSKPSKSEDFGYENHPTACLFEFAIKTQLDLLSSCCGTQPRQWTGHLWAWILSEIARSKPNGSDQRGRIELMDQWVYGLISWVVARTSLKSSVATGSLDYFANKNSIFLEMSRCSNTSLLDRWFQEPR